MMVEMLIGDGRDGDGDVRIGDGGDGTHTCSCHLVVMEEKANKRSQISSPYTISVIGQDDNVIM